MRAFVWGLFYLLSFVPSHFLVFLRWCSETRRGREEERYRRVVRLSVVNLDARWPPWPALMASRRNKGGCVLSHQLRTALRRNSGGRAPGLLVRKIAPRVQARLLSTTPVQHSTEQFYYFGFCSYYSFAEDAMYTGSSKTIACHLYDHIE